MESPRIRYAQTADGVSVAYIDVGEGTPIVHMPATPFSHVQLEWGIPRLRQWYERLVAAGHRLVRYDARGTGLSDREVEDYTLEARLLDLDAVVEQIESDRFVLFASGDTGMEAIAWAVAHPERVSHLVLWCAWANRADVSKAPQTKSLRALMEQDWTIYTETAARVLVGWSNEEEARILAAFYRECTSPEVLKLSVPLVYEWDVTALLPQVQCPTLVMQRRDTPSLDPKVAQALAKGIPDARLVLLDGNSPLPFLGDTSAMLGAIGEFLGDAKAARMVGSTGDAPVTIFFTDITDSTKLTQKLGDARAHEILHVHNSIVREALAAHGGREIKHTGDGLMASFRSATQAVECAIAVQQAVAAHLEQQPDDALRVHIGLNAGEPVAEAGDYFGTAVQLAARICEIAGPGQILVSGVVRDLAAGKGLLFADLGEKVPRGFEDAVRLYEAHW
ncbi:MAG: adenylate/guanylate cyclase domain-containing protein [Dehalococcoidia bacterium]